VYNVCNELLKARKLGLRWRRRQLRLTELGLVGRGGRGERVCFLIRDLNDSTSLDRNVLDHVSSRTHADKVEKSIVVHAE
jgi:hypothetical protein